MKKSSSAFPLMAVVIFSLLIFVSCNNGSKTGSADNQKATLSDSTRVDSLTSQKKELIEYKFLSAEANLPSPFEIVNDLFNFKAPYKAELLNPYSNADHYVTAYKKAVNFGVYGVDQAYMNFYGHSMDQMNYYSATQKLAQGLNMDAAFSQFSERFKANENNSDSIARLLDNAFNETDGYLRKNQRFLVASHVMAGALIEVNYLSLNLLKDVPKTAGSDTIFEKVYNENLYILKLINLLKEYTDADSKNLSKSLQDYQQSYLAIIKTPADLTPANIDKATALITKVRSELIK